MEDSRATDDGTRFVVEASLARRVMQQLLEAFSIFNIVQYCLIGSGSQLCAKLADLIAQNRPNAEKR